MDESLLNDSCVACSGISRHNSWHIPCHHDPKNVFKHIFWIMMTRKLCLLIPEQATHESFKSDSSNGSRLCVRVVDTPFQFYELCYRTQKKIQKCSINKMSTMVFISYESVSKTQLSHNKPLLHGKSLFGEMQWNLEIKVE